MNRHEYAIPIATAWLVAGLGGLLFAIFVHLLGGLAFTAFCFCGLQFTSWLRRRNRRSRP